MELFNPKNLNFDFVKYFKVGGIVSIVLTLAGAFSFFYPGLNYGIDFRGGVEARVEFKDTAVNSEKIRSALDPKIQNLGVVSFSDAQKNEFVITGLPKDGEDVGSVISQTLAQNFGNRDEAWHITSQSFVGPRVGKELRKSALLALLYTTILVAIYMYWRFDSRFSPGAIACIIHDLLMTIGFLVITQTEFSVTIVAALLTLAGYSINDTVVVFDRIRETEGKFLGKDLKFIVNEAINSTLSRTIMTAGTTIISCIVLWVIGSGEIPAFARTLLFGIFVGTYSSAFVASPLFMWASNKNNIEGRTAHAGAANKG